ncbi:MAG: Fis family transcriptional regulator, partial [Verrucomicrobia bacterium]|nr:Fis family transcriptional regulator [Verrucomicrobiota bacterium]
PGGDSVMPTAQTPRLCREDAGTSEVLTEAEMQQRKRANLLAALEKTGWKIRGADGAAELIGLKPTTLLSRMKRMGLQRPD